MEARTIGVVGAGTMGSGISQAFAVAGMEVLMTDISKTQLERATGFTPGFPTEFIDDTTPWVFAAAATAVDRGPSRRV